MAGEKVNEQGAQETKQRVWFRCEHGHAFWVATPFEGTDTWPCPFCVEPLEVSATLDSSLNDLQRRLTEAEAHTENFKAALKRVIDGRYKAEEGLLTRAGQAEARASELDAIFDLQWKRDIEAVQRWRAEDVEARQLTHPDRGTLLDYLWEHMLKAEARVQELETALTRLYRLADRLDDCLLEFGQSTDGCAACAEHLDALERVLAEMKTTALTPPATETQA